MPAATPEAQAPEAQAPAPGPAPAPTRAPIPLRPVTPPPPPPAPSARDRDDTGRTEISALVERIAQFRRERGDNPLDLEQSPRLPLGELPVRVPQTVTSFGFAADTAGRIGWATGEVAPMVVGMRPFAAAPDDAASAARARAFARRQPINGSAIALAGAPAIAGDWIIDAEPRFSEDGHFTGYVGRLRRLPAAAAAPSGPEAREADRIRQLLHELRTPVTAVQGYAEVIQQQLFGPAPHEYRALAAAIAADAARILAGFEELDRLARLETGAMRVEAGEADLAALILRTAAQLDPVLGPLGAGLDPEFAASTQVIVALDPDDAEALVWRLLASLGAACGAGERIAVRLDPMIGGGRAGMARLVCDLPARLAGEDNLFAATTRSGDSAINAGLFGTGFALRLARAEARAAGGSLVRTGGALELTLPLLTALAGVPSAWEA
jgi:signal transduction histidine kinase